MKFLKLLAAVILISTPSFAQTNTFPSSGNVGIGTTSPRSKLEIVGDGYFSSSATGSSLKLESSGLPTNNDYSNVRLVAGSDGGSGGYLTTKLDNWGGYFNWTRGSSSGDVTVMHLNATTGNLGIGTTSPNAKLEVKSFGANTPIIKWTASGGNHLGHIYEDASGAPFFTLANATGTETIIFHAANNGNCYFNTGGNVLIGGTTLPASDAKLAVAGNIYSRKVKVTQTGWADYVFHPTYKLPSLAEVEAYIKQHHHLPDIPSAKEVEKNGLDLGENQVALLKKIEELTLYVIEMKKENEQMKKEIRSMKVTRKK